MPEHGTRQRYQRGCHCADCIRANTLYQRDYRMAWRVVHHVDGTKVRYAEPALPGLGVARRS
jgi:hypothetical protein